MKKVRKLDVLSVSWLVVVAVCVLTAFAVFAHAQTVGRIMHRLGWVRKRETAGERHWYYEPMARPKDVPPDPSGVPF